MNREVERIEGNQDFAAELAEKKSRVQQHLTKLAGIKDPNSIALEIHDTKETELTMPGFVWPVELQEYCDSAAEIVANFPDTDDALDADTNRLISLAHTIDTSKQGDTDIVEN